MVAITPLPNAPEVVMGVITVEGRTIPALSLRRRFRLPERAPGLSDHFLIAHTGRRRVALWVDAVSGIVERPREQIVSADAVLPGLGQIEGVIALADGVVLIHDVNQCLSLGEEQRLTEALQG
jgi:purine-binding chemotaxis protein CheW